MTNRLYPVDYDGRLGVDLLSGRVKISPLAAQRLKNWMYLPSGSLAPRFGRQYVGLNDGGLGCGDYIERIAGADVKTAFTVSDELNELTVTTFKIDYSGAAASVRIQKLVDADTNTWKFQVFENSTEALDEDLGVGVDEATPYELADLKTAIEAISADFTVTITGDDTIPAAFIDTQVNQALTAGSPQTITLNIFVSSICRTPDNAPAPFVNHNSGRNADKFRPAMFLNHHGVLLIATNDDVLKKWDGNLCLNAGMTVGAITSATPTGGGAITAEWNYKVRYSHIDAKGNYVPGDLSDYKAASMVTHTQCNLVIPTLQTTSGYSTDYAKVNGLQAGVNTITVDSGHTLQIGDKVALLDTSGSTRFAVIRNVTGIAATTVTIDGAVVTVADNSIISQALLIEIYRTKSRGSLLYEVAALPNDPSASSLTFADTVVDASLGDLFQEPDVPLTAPGKGGILVLHQNIPVQTANPDYPNRIYPSDALYPEAFPDESSFDAFSQKGGAITCLGPNQAGLEIFYADSHYRLYGDFADGIYELRPVSLALGCVGSHAFAALDTGRMVWITHVGPRQMNPGGYPQYIGLPVDTLITENSNDAKDWMLGRSFIVDLPHDKMVLFHLVTESLQGSNIYEDTYAETWAHDYRIEGQPRWVGPWTNLNMGGGAFVRDQDCYFIEKRYSAVSGDVEVNLQRFIRRLDEFGQVDHTEEIPAEWAPGWEDLGNRNEKKIAEYLRVYSTDFQRTTGFSLQIRFEMNMLENVGTTIEFELGQGGAASGWWFDPWGAFAWGSPANNFNEINVPDDMSGVYQFRPVFIHSKIYERPIISLYTVKYSGPYAMGLARE